MDSAPDPELIYKVLDTQTFVQARAAGELVGSAVDLADGYIHFSTAAQLPGTLVKHYAGRADLVLLGVRTADAGPLRWEVSRGNALFPHLYASLPMAAVAWSQPIAVDADGSCDLPEAVR